MRKIKMDCLTDDLCAIVLARLPIKTITASKVVCKQWKSIVESPFFRELFISLHQNSNSCSWSLMYEYGLIENMAHYRCETWGLEKSLDFYVSSFLTRLNNSYSKKPYLPSSVVAYSDVGLVLVHTKPLKDKHGTLYVANPVSRESVEIIFSDALPLGFVMSKVYPITGIVTRTDDKGVVLSYKVVLMDETQTETTSLTFLIYSSETGSWSLNTFHLPYSLTLDDPRFSISLNGNLHWLARNDVHVMEELVVSIDFYAGSDRCRVTPFPDLDKTTTFQRAFTASQGFLMYMNIVSDSDSEDKLCLWRLHSDGWQLVSSISPTAFMSTGFDYPLTINPFDGKTAYFCSKEQQGLLSINLHNGKFVLHNQLEHSREDGRIMVSVQGPRFMIYLQKSMCFSFVLPQWLQRIPNTVTRV